MDAATITMQRHRFCSALLPLCLIIGILLGAAVKPAKAGSKGVEVILTTKWNATSLLLEAYEFMVRLEQSDGYR